ncbi:MAG: succinate dehydrogenase, cytochrome b556 subunit [Gammaproteobacteria bacterium]|nr:succinate dehydrogenase, cytochrome b556 subunit [Gammaproteobacteria bacterium]
MNNKSRPKHLNLFKVRLPISGIASILHRLSGLLLFLATPLMLYILTISFKNNSGFEQAKLYLDSMWVKFIILILIWSAMHHFLAGLRYLVIDMDVGLSKNSANLSALLVSVLALVLSIIIIIGVL